MNNSFNLVEEKWIRCQLRDGTFEEIGLYEILARAHEIKTLVSDFSMEKVALFRLLLAVLHRNFGPQTTREWQDLWKKKKFDKEKLESYFEKWHDRFNLFDALPIVKRIALNLDQVEQYNPPPNPAKKTDSRWKKYVDEYGITDSWELDALEPQVLVDLITDEVESLVDGDLWQARLDEENAGKAALKEMRLSYSG